MTLKQHRTKKGVSKKYMHYTDNLEGYVVCRGGQDLWKNTTNNINLVTCPLCLGFIRNQSKRFIDIQKVKDYIDANKILHKKSQVWALVDLDEFKKFLNQNGRKKGTKI